MKLHTTMAALLLTFTGLGIQSAGAIEQGPASIPDADIASLRMLAIDQEPAAPRMANSIDNGKRPVREYPMQAPTIPHRIDNYQVNLNANKCLSCHSRQRTRESMAPMVSITHFEDREGNVLAEISPRRYFCDQCHVVQTDAEPLVGNSFMDVDAVMKQSGKTTGH